MKPVWRTKNETAKNIALAFVLDLKLKKDSVMKFAGSTAVRVFFDNELAFHGPFRTAHGRSTVHTLTVKKNVKRIAVEVVCYRINTYFFVNEQPFFAAEIISDGKTLYGSEDFSAYYLDDRIEKSQRYSFQRGFVESYDFKQDRSALFSENIPYKKIAAEVCRPGIFEETGLTYPLYETVEPLSVIETGTVKKIPSDYKFHDRALTDVGEEKHVGGYKMAELSEILSDEICALNYYKADIGGKTEGTYKLYEFERELTGFFSMEVNAAEDCEIYITFDEIIWNECTDKTLLSVFHDGAKAMIFQRLGATNAIKYRLKKGSYKLLTFEPTSLKSVKIIIASGRAGISAFKAVLYQNPDMYKLKFKASDTRLTKIFNAGIHTLSQNAVDVLTDCPSRERAGWLCDSYFSSKVELLATGQNNVESSLLYAYANAPQLSTLPKGMIPMCYPADHEDGVFIPTWALWYVLEIEDNLIRSGNGKLAEASKAKVYGIINYFLDKFINSDGLLENLESWVFVEWSKANDYINGVNYPCNMLFYAALNAAGRLYGDKKFTAAAQKVKDVIIKQSFNGELFEDNKIRDRAGALQKTGNISETCQYFAFYFGIADKKEYAGLYDFIFNVITPLRDEAKDYPHIAKANSLVGNYLRFDYLLKEQRIPQLIGEVENYFSLMAERTGTLWEHDKPIASCNHAFAAMASEWIVKALTGYVRTDFAAKKIYFTGVKTESVTSVKIPVGDEYIDIKVNAKDRQITVPEGYDLIKE